MRSLLIADFHVVVVVDAMVVYSWILPMRDTVVLEIHDSNGNPNGKGYNDWQMGWFETKEDCSMDQYHLSKSDTMRNVGKAYLREVCQGNFGAYCIANHPTYPYYVCEWIGEPYMADKSEVLSIGSENFTVHKGDYLCRGIWLEKLEGTRN